MDEDGILLDPCCGCEWCGVNGKETDYECTQRECAHSREYQFAEDDLLGLNDYDEE